MGENIVLIVESVSFVQRSIQKSILKDFSFEVIIANSRLEAHMVIDRLRDDIFIAVVGLNLPDSNGFDVVDDLEEMGVPQVVYSGKFDFQIRQELLNRDVVDYIPQEGRNSLTYLLELLRRLLSNQKIEALIVDDSRASCVFFSKMLSRMMIPCKTMVDSSEALELLVDDPDRFSLVLVDYAMPVLNGVEFVLELQKQVDVKGVAVIGMSGQNNHALTAHFLKAGANDFLYKSSSYEEFMCRISQSLNAVDQVSKLTKVASTDFLTGLRNRRDLFDVGNIFWQLAKREGRNDICVCMLDIDYFKNVNDTYGHDAGDSILKGVAEIIDDSFRKTDLISRYGGEEFCIVLQSSNEELVVHLMDRLRERIGSHSFYVGEYPINVSVSIGCCFELYDSFDEMISIADKNLYRAKDNGRNCVVA